MYTQLSLKSTKGLLDKQIEELTEVMMQTAEENLGMAMIYTIVEALKEWLVDHNQPQGVRWKLYLSSG